MNETQRNVQIGVFWGLFHFFITLPVALAICLGLIAGLLTAFGVKF